MEEDDNNNSDDVQEEEWYTYKIGDRTFHKLGDTRSHPEELKTCTHVRIEDDSAIPSNAFFGFQALVALDLMLGLQEIGDRAFQYCSSLKFVSIPSTVTVIGGRAFQACSSLETVNIPKSTSIIRPGAFSSCSALTTVNLAKDGSLEILEDFVFSGCSDLILIHVPASVKHIREGAFFCCLQLLTIELPIGILSLGKRCFNDTGELSNMIIPSTVDCIEDDLFAGAVTIREAVLKSNNSGEEESDVEDEDDEDTNTDLVNAMVQRFDGLPLHKLCYYHTYSPMDTTLNDIQNHSQDYDQVDMFGMTPIHVLALSTEPNVKLFKELAKSVQPKIFTAKDKRDMRPIEYLVNNSSSMSPYTEESINFLIEHTLVVRSQGLGLDRWKSEISNQVATLDFNSYNTGLQQLDSLYAKLETLELLETTSLVEMFLWNMRMAEAKKASPSNVDRMACRISCGADIVIRNVLLFLLNEE